MKIKLKELRKSRRMTQAHLGGIIGVTQQNLSRYENESIMMPADVLVRLAEYFNVTTDYLLGVSQIKRNFEQQIVVNKTIDEYYDLIELFVDLKEDDRELVLVMIEKLRELRKKRG